MVEQNFQKRAHTGQTESFTLEGLPDNHRGNCLGNLRYLVSQTVSACPI